MQFDVANLTVVVPFEREGRMLRVGDTVAVPVREASALLEHGFCVPFGYEPPVEHRPYIGRLVWPPRR